MSFKKTLLAAAMAIAASSSADALAGSLASVAGPVEFKLSGVTTSFFTQSDTNEKTWGVGNITQITTPSTSGAAPLWSAGEGGDYLGYMLYGVADLSSSGTGPISLYNVGAVDGAAIGSGCGALCGSIYIDMFKRTSNPSPTTPSARTGYNSYTGVSDGLSLWLRLQLIPGIVADDAATPLQNELTTATLSQTLTAVTLPASGHGSFFANVIGGSAMALYNTNGFTTLLSTSADMRGLFDLVDNTLGGTCSPSSTDCFFGVIHDPVSANAVPEPGSIALLGLGLLAMGVAGLGRRNIRQACPLN